MVTIKEAAEIIKKHCKSKDSCKSCTFNSRPKDLSPFHCKLRSQPRCWSVGKDDDK